MTADCRPGDHPLDLSNPYPGPRPFPRPEKREGVKLAKRVFFGRDSERQDLYDLLIAERIVVLYSPSGAGKTSLVQAALIPDMEDRGFEVLPVMRCIFKPEKKIDPAANRYVLSLFLSLEADRQPEERLPLADLVSRACKERSLDEYLSEREENAIAKAAPSRVKGTFLIFDQFEEIFTEDITDQAERAAFFLQISIALRHPRRWALFVMREEFLGSLESSVRRMPAQFRARFGLEYLDPRAATEAIVQPACQHGVEFQEDAAEKLVNNLRQVLDPGASGEGGRKLGPYIEPVQLQLVCEQLWEKRIDALDAGTHPDTPPAITVDNVREFGDVDRALGTYYADKVAAASGITGVRERKIREWIDLNLITGRGFRDQVQHEPDATRGLDNRVLTLLAKAHVLRAERRRDLTWYELSHDRWIWPIQESNRAWRATSLSDFQNEAELWINRGRHDEYLLRGRALSRAESWADEHLKDMEPHEIEFLKESRAQQWKHRARIGMVMVVSAIVLGLVVYILLQASRERGMQDSLTQLKNSSAKTAAAADMVLAAAPLTVQAASAAEQAAIATLSALAQVARTQAADPLVTTSEDVASVGTVVAATRTRAYEDMVAAESSDATAAADQQRAQVLQTSVAQEESTLQPVPEPPTSTDTPTATPAPTATPTPRPTATPQPKPTAIPVPIACAAEPVGKFVAIWQGLKERLGCPTRTQPTEWTPMAKQQFERGFMFWSQQPTNLVLAVVPASQGRELTWSEYRAWSFVDGSALCASQFSPGPDHVQPINAFGGVWCDNKAVRDALGWAVGDEYSIQGMVQEFDQGFVLRDETGQVWVLFRSGGLQTEMAYITGGTLQMGSPSGEGDADEWDEHPVTIFDFWMDLTEVTNREYRACEAAGTCKAPHQANGQLQVDSVSHPNYHTDPRWDRYPVIFVSWSDAKTYCEWLGKRLPTEAEWEWAAGASDGRRYPWGPQEPDDSRAWFLKRPRGDTRQVGSYAAGANDLYDMAGNVWEWTSSLYKDYPYNGQDGREDAQAGGLRVLRGGSWRDDAKSLRVANRNVGTPPDHPQDNVGFRCVRSAE